MNFETVRVRFRPPVCFLQIHRPWANNTIDALLVQECHKVLDMCQTAETDPAISVVVVEGLPEVFCFGADFKEMAEPAEDAPAHDPASLYDLWLRLSCGPFITISHVRGKTNAGGVGFAAACDIVLADRTAQFSLSELLFNLFPACVLPFLIRRIGFQKAHYLTLTTRPVDVEKACEWGLVDAYDADSETLVRQHLLRLRYLSVKGISQYKAYMGRLSGMVHGARSAALEANREIFSDPGNQSLILRYVREGLFPWET